MTALAMTFNTFILSRAKDPSEFTHALGSLARLRMTRCGYDSDIELTS